VLHTRASTKKRARLLETVTPHQRLADRVISLPVASIKPFPNNPRRHPRAQIEALLRSIKRGWTNPILIDETHTILAGHGRLQAAMKLGLETVPMGRTEEGSFLLALGTKRECGSN
jgi:hypothetical protein